MTEDDIYGFYVRDSYSEVHDFMIVDEDMLELCTNHKGGYTEGI